jgi:ADP-ribose pyrophosphatase YjhB (NUDIX family)
MKNENDEEFLATYNQENYDRPSLAVDMAVFTIKSKEVSNIRKLTQKQLSLLLIKRGEPPFANSWALPGGFLRRGETLETAAYRELKEETGVEDVYLSQLYSFSDPNRDPRGWIVSKAFIALASEDNFRIQSGTDATDAKWFQVSYVLMNEKVENNQFENTVKRQYRLLLDSEGLYMEAMIEKQVIVTNKRVRTDFVLISKAGLAFDHALIIARAIDTLRASLDKSMLAFELVSETFTLTELQQIYETILEESFITANFRRKIAGSVIETNDWVKETGYRPAKLFKRNLDSFS